jgi:DNA-binding winged helix-turn-helix (wHTH) protein
MAQRSKRCAQLPCTWAQWQGVMHAPTLCITIFAISPPTVIDYQPERVMLSNLEKPHLPRVRLRFDRFELDETEARLVYAGEPLALAPKPFAVLCALARAPRMLVTKDALLDAVWGHRFVSDSVLKSTISEVRSALQDDPKQPRCIETVHTRGYRFIAAAVSVPSQPEPAAAVDAVAAPDPSAQRALMLLCRSDAALARLIRAVAATLERERFPSTEIDPSGMSAVDRFGRDLVPC